MKSRATEITLLFDYFIFQELCSFVCFPAKSYQLHDMHMIIKVHILFTYL